MERKAVGKMNVEIKITLKIMDVEIVLTPDELKKLHEELGKLVGAPSSPGITVIPYTEPNPIPFEPWRGPVVTYYTTNLPSLGGGV